MDQQIDDGNCLRCGLCCKHYINGRWVNCQYLVKISKTKFACRIYHNRIGHIIVDTPELKTYCCYRNEVKLNYPGCVYNVEGQEMSDKSRFEKPNANCYTKCFVNQI